VNDKTEILFLTVQQCTVHEYCDMEAQQDFEQEISKLISAFASLRKLFETFLRNSFQYFNFLLID
jgi:hypothetical protein